MGNREQVKDAVRRAAGCCDAGHRVQERAPVEEPARGHALFHELHGERTGAGSGFAFQLVLVRRDEPRRRRTRFRGSRSRRPSCWR